MIILDTDCVSLLERDNEDAAVLRKHLRTIALKLRRRKLRSRTFKIPLHRLEGRLNARETWIKKCHEPMSERKMSLSARDIRLDW